MLTLSEVKTRVGEIKSYRKIKSRENTADELLFDFVTGLAKGNPDKELTQKARLVLQAVRLKERR